MKILKTFSLALTGFAAFALVGCDSGKSAGPNQDSQSTTSAAGVTQVEQTPEPPSASQVPATDVLSTTGAFHYKVGGAQGNCQILRQSVVCNGQPPAGTGTVNQRGMEEKVGAVDLGESGITWYPAERVGGIHGEKILPVGGSVSKDGITCTQMNDDEFTCANAQGSFTITGAERRISLTGSTSAASSTKQSDFTEVNPANYQGRSGKPLFDFSNGGKVMGWCALEQDALYCGIGEDQSGNNTVKVTDHSVQSFRGEGPLETGLKKLQAGERITYGSAACYRPSGTSIVCNVDDEKIQIEGPSYQLKINQQQ